MRICIKLGPDHSTEEEIPDGPDEETNNLDGDTVRRGLTATDLYDLTLTAVAFLGFGTFVMNLVMDAMTASTYRKFRSVVSQNFKRHFRQSIIYFYGNRRLNILINPNSVYGIA